MVAWLVSTALAGSAGVWVGDAVHTRGGGAWGSFEVGPRAGPAEGWGVTGSLTAEFSLCERSFGGGPSSAAFRHERLRGASLLPEFAVTHPVATLRLGLGPTVGWWRVEQGTMGSVETDVGVGLMGRARFAAEIGGGPWVLRLHGAVTDVHAVLDERVWWDAGVGLGGRWPRRAR